MRKSTSYVGLEERPAAASVNSSVPGERRLRERQHVDRLDRDLPRVDVEGVGARPLDVRGAAHDAGRALADVDAVEPHARPDEPQRRPTRSSSVSPYAIAGATVTRPKPNGSRYLPYRWNSPGHGRRRRDTRRGRRRGGGPPGSSRRSVTTALISSPPSLRGYPSEKRPSARSVPSPLRATRVGDVDVAVLDDDAALAAAPVDVPRAHARGRELALDARRLERVEQHAVERARAAHLDRRASASRTRS